MNLAGAHPVSESGAVSGSCAPADPHPAEVQPIGVAGGRSADEINRVWPHDTVLPPYSALHRVPEWEPEGRWLRDRPQLDWPDAMLSARFGPHILRGLLVVALVVGQITAGGGWQRHLVGLAIGLLLWGWLEWWFRWDLTPLSRRIIVIAGNWILTAALIVVTPLGGIFAWSGYLIAGTFFTGWLLLLAVPLSCVLMTATQFGGFEEFAGEWTLFTALMALNTSIGLASIILANRREEAVLRRGATFRQLLATQQENSTLQRHIVEQARQQGILGERARLARELHDTMAQGLVAVVTQLEAIDDAQVRSADVARRVERAKDLARQSLGEARRAVNALRPPALDDRGLPDALERLVADWAELNGVAAQHRVSGDPRATEQDAALVRVAQEALSNVARHAAAHHVAVTLTYLDDEVLLDIRDDGTGFDPAARPEPGVAGGHGLPGMAERLRLADGRLAVESEPGGGCVVSAAVPG